MDSNFLLFYIVSYNDGPYGSFYIYVCSFLPQSVAEIQIILVLKQTGATLEFYFRFRFRPYYRLHIKIIQIH